MQLSSDRTMDDPTVISAERIARLRENLLTKAEVLIAAIDLEPEDQDERDSNQQMAETIYLLVQSFVDLR